VANVGHALLLLGRLDEAESMNRRAVALNPALAVAHNNLGLALAALGKRASRPAATARARAAA
jgi:tetratricopeptide (TPR) repeat protein